MFTMLKRLSAALMAVALTLSVASTALAFSGPSPWPGRPLRYDGSGDQCQALAYARVGGSIVMLTANHCRLGGEVEGAPAYTNGNVQIGTLGHMDASWTQNDLVYIVLNSTYRPTSGLNQVYFGPLGNWTITTNPTSSDGCAGFVSGETVWHDAQTTWTSSNAYVVGTEEVKVNHASDPGCTIESTIAPSGGSTVDSGSPFFRSADATTITGVTTGQCNPDCGVAHNGTRAWLCQTSTC